MSLKYWFVKNVYPTTFGSKCMGVLMRMQWGPFQGMVNKAFAGICHIRKDTVADPLWSYRSVDAFFTRTLRPDMRPISKHSWISPVDGKVGSHGKLVKGQAMQAKGITYSMDDFIAEKSWADTLQSGSFLTIYLAPHNYHRVHAPADMIISAVAHIPGGLMPVFPEAVAKITDLYVTNERVVFYGEALGAPCALVMVGATHVGSMSSTLCSLPLKHETNSVTLYKLDNVNVAKGEELGIFHMGSTVVLLWGKEDDFPWHVMEEEPLLMGEGIQLTKDKND